MTDQNPIGEGVLHADIVLTIIISCYNDRDLVADCLRSIYQNPPTEPYEIILVDDASSDGTSEMAVSAFPEVRLLRNDVNRHYTYSNNRALDQACGTYVLLLNSDTIVLPQALDLMIDFLRKHPEAGAVGCKLLNEDGTIQWSVKSLPNPAAAVFGARSIFTKWFPNNRFSSQHLLHIGRDMTQPFVAGLVSSAASMMPRPVIKEVGYLDVQFFYHVDADYCKRIADAGYKCYYLPTAAIIHLNHKGGTMPSSIGAFSVVDDVRNLELSVLSQAHPDIVVDPDADRRRGRALVSFFGVGVRASLRRAPRDCAGRISCQKAGGSLIASREPKALEDIAEQSFAPQRRPERFVWFHTTYDDHSLSVGPLTLREFGKGVLPGCCFCPTRFL